jgi:gliding motility-associated-like protein
MWTWMSGSAGLNNTPPNHGVVGVPAQSNTPGGRWTDSRWRDSNGNFWLFSGITGTFANPYADVWKFNPSTLLWTWMGGANTTNFTDSFTVKCSLNGGCPASADLNTVCWIDDCDRLWQFGGEGRNPFSVGYTNATWFFDPVSRKFKWQGGDLAYLQPGVYGAQGVSSPSNYPPSAMGGIGFNDNQGNFWMFGGCITPLFPGGAAETNTMWKFRPDSICNQLPSTTPIQTSISAFVPSACSPLQINFQSAISNSSFDYQWNFGDPNSTQDTASTVSTSYTFSSPGVYSVSLIVSGNSGCISGIDTAFFQLDLSNVNPLASSFSVSACSSYTAPWGAVYAQSGVYSDTLTAANGCDSIVTVNLTIKSPSQTNQNISSCGSFTAPDGTVYNQNSTFSSTFTGSNNCDSVVTYNLTILPPASVSVSPSDLNLSLGDTVQLFATGGSSYQWSPADGLSCTTCPSPLASPQTSVVYTVSTTNASGCTNSDSIRIKVDIKCNQLFIPDIFTPNATGPAVNEKLCAYSNCIRLFSFIIYNRWGEQVFETTDIAACWDGTYKGKESPSGIYAFKLYAEQIDGTIVDKKGTITLVR